MFDWVRFDITDIVFRRKDFLESSMMTLNLIKNEIFVFHQKIQQDETSSLQKRSIIFPFSLMYKFKEFLTYEKTNNAVLTKYDTLYIVDKIVLRVSSTDSMVALSALKYVGMEFERYKKLPLFPTQSKNSPTAVQPVKKNSVAQPKVTVIGEKHKIMHDGMQIVPIFCLLILIFLESY